MKFILEWLVYAIAIWVTSYILPGVSVDGVDTLMVVAVVLGAINTFVKPVLVLLTLPITLLTFGLFLIVINTLLIMLAGAIVPGFVVAGFWWALIFSIVLSIIGGFLRSIARETGE